MTTFKKYAVYLRLPNAEPRVLRFNTVSEIINHFNISSMSVYYKIKAKQLKFKHPSTAGYLYIDIVKEKRPRNRRKAVSAVEISHKFR